MLTVLKFRLWESDYVTKAGDVRLHENCDRIETIFIQVLIAYTYWNQVPCHSGSRSIWY